MIKRIIKKLNNTFPVCLSNMFSVKNINTKTTKESKNSLSLFKIADLKNTTIHNVNNIKPIIPFDKTRLKY